MRLGQALASELDNSNPVLKVDGLSVWFGSSSAPVLKGLALEVQPGETIGIVGSSGSGKTTLAKAILGVLPASAKQAGLIQLRTKRPGHFASDRRFFSKGSDVSLLTQEPWSALNPAMSIKSQFKEAILAHHPEQTRDQVLEKTLSSLVSVGLELKPERLRHYPKEFSGGQQQRICAALALLHEPRLLIADEPTSSLDKVSQAGVLDLLFQEQRRLGMALILISHDTSELQKRCSRVLELVDGKLQDAVTTIQMPARRRPQRKSQSDQPLVLAQNLEFWRFESGKKHSVFEQVSFELFEGESVGLTGVSGAGKTTVARLLAGLERPSAGTLQILNKDLSLQKLTKRRRAGLAMVFQDSALSLNPTMKVSDIVLEPLRSQGVKLSKLESTALVEKALGDVGLNSSLAQSYPRFLSGGQRQRVNIARALALGPKLLIADEPASSLDRTNAIRILDLLSSLQQTHGFGLILISHDDDLLQQYTDRVIEIRPRAVGDSENK